MSAGGGGGGENDSDFELNLAPVIDCFTVLITYMLVSASFISLDLLEVQVAMSSDAPVEEPQQEPKDMLSLEMKEGKVMELKITGKRELSYPVSPLRGGDWNLEAMRKKVEQIRMSSPGIEEISVKAAPAVRYKEIVQVVENLKPAVPKVFIGE